ncbi:hypothetical protein D3C83_281010 [compost metagenome]
MLEYETLSGDEVKALLRGEEIRREDDTGGAGATAKKPRASVPSTDGGRKRPPTLEPEPQPGG